ncbi:MAG: pitrilysin family protein [Pseudomonadota bacterium]
MIHRLTKDAAALGAAALIGGALAVAPAWGAAKIQEVTTPDGHALWLVEERSIPIITIQLSFRGGASIEAPEESGLTTFLASMLDEGAGDLDAAGFAARAEELAARFSFSAGRDALSVSASMLLERRDESLALLASALSAPRFDAAPVERVRQQILSKIRQDESDPDALAAAAWLNAAFPADSYGRRRSGTTETVTAITADDLRAATARLLNAGDVKISVVGAVSAEEAGAAVDTLLAGLARTERTAPPAPEMGLPAAGGLETVPFESPQSNVLFGHSGILRQDPDFIPAYVMNYILGGGGFSSRLTEEIRVKRGLTYSVYSYLSPFERAGVYLGGVATSNERVAESIDLVRAEWRRMAEEGVSDEELDKAKRYLTGAFPLNFDSNAKIARFLISAQVSELGADYIERRNDLVNAVTAADIQRVAQRLLKPDALYFVVVGRPVGL